MGVEDNLYQLLLKHKMPEIINNKDLKKVFIIDTNALAHRAFHAYPSTLQTKSGLFVNAVYGFASMLMQVLTTYKPDYLVFAQDSKELTFRHKLYEKYKANRPKMDELLVSQIPLISELIDSLNVPRIVMPGFEADDIIGSLIKTGKLEAFQTIIVTGDKDLLQLLDHNVHLYMPQSSFSQAVLHDETSAKIKMGFDTKYMVDYKALRGDPSDNIPGIKGIGDKTATELINKYNTLDNIYAHIDELKGSVKTKFEEQKEIAYISRDLAQIKTDLEIKFELDNSELRDINFGTFAKFCEKFEFYSLLRRVNKLAGNDIVPTKEPTKTTNTKIIDFKKVEVKSKAELVKVLDGIKGSEEFVFDFNADIENNIFLPSDGFVIVQGNTAYLFGNKDIDKETKNLLEKLLKQGNAIVYDAKKQYQCLLNIDIPINEIQFKRDLLLVDYLVSEGSKQTNIEGSFLKWLNKNVEHKQQESLFDKNDNYEQACDILLLNEVLVEELQKYPKLIDLNENIELPLTKVLTKIERNGIGLNSDYLKGFEKELDQSLAEISKKIFDEAGETFNLSSPKQLGVVLFQNLKLPNPKKTKGGGVSTDEKVLMNYVKDYPIVASILQYRELFKLKSTYTSTLINQINPKTNRIHSTFNQAVVATGRLSSRNPNMQNIPTSSDLGQKIRSAFVANEGNVLVSFDYAQQELRLLAHLSKEEKLLDIFRQNIDIHTATASNLFGIPIDQVTKKHRRIGKTVNFGVVYGISAFGLADRLKITNDEAQKFINRFYDSFPGVKVYFEELKSNARNLGFVETIFGRRKNALGLNNPNFQARMGKEREIINFPLQGSAADIMKLAMINAQKYIDELNDKNIKMVLQVHDELIFEIPDDTKISTGFVSKIREIMMNAYVLDIPLNVEAGIAKSWGELK